MNDTLAAVGDALQVLREENPESEAIAILENSVRLLCKQYLLDMTVMTRAVGYETMQKELANAEGLIYAYHVREQELKKRGEKPDS